VFKKKEGHIKIEDKYGIGDKFTQDDYEEIKIKKVLRSENSYLFVLLIKNCYVFVRKNIEEIVSMLETGSALVTGETMVDVVAKY